MISTNICILVTGIKVASALEGFESKCYHISETNRGMEQDFQKHLEGKDHIMVIYFFASYTLL